MQLLILTLFIDVNCLDDTAKASVFPKNIISIEKNDSNLGCLVIFEMTRPKNEMNLGNIPKYIKISNTGTTSRIGNKAETAISIFPGPGATKLSNANPIPENADSNNHDTPSAALLTNFAPNEN